MSNKFLDLEGIKKLITLLKNTFVKKETGKELMTTEEKNKLAGLNNYVHPTTPGNKHIPSGGEAGQILKWTADGTAVWGADKDTTYNNATTVADGLMSKEDKNKINTIANGAQVNIIESIKVNGTAQSVSNKSVDISVPTNNNQLTNGAGYQTASQVTEAINSAVGGITGLEYQIVSELPASGKKGTIYLISNSGTNPNAYDEYIWVNTTFEKIGSTEVDLSGYLKTTDMVAITEEELELIFEEGN